jgi:hypothetical protein
VETKSNGIMVIMEESELNWRIQRFKVGCIYSQEFIKY